jgi:regulator of protease activity HflC (stomatin/prohibitin superfamily)
MARINTQNPKPGQGSSDEHDDGGGGRPSHRLGVLTIIGLIAVALLTLMILSWRNIRPGYVGIVFDKATHQVTTGALEPGWAFINPFTQAIKEYPVTIQTYSMVERQGEGSSVDDDSIKVQSSEGQQLNLDVVIQYKVIREEAAQLYEDWGGADISLVEDRVVRQYTRSQVPVIAAQYGWEEITAAKRGEIVDLIAETLREEFALRHLNMVSFGIREVHLPESLQRALDNKIESQQQAERQRYELEKAGIRAEQDKVEAQGRAEAVKAEAEGDAQAIRIRAEAQAEANTILARSVTEGLIRYQQIQRWDGELPMLMGGESATPFFDVYSLLHAQVSQQQSSQASQDRTDNTEDTDESEETER